jgi:hypothetical protein
MCIIELFYISKIKFVAIKTEFKKKFDLILCQTKNIQQWLLIVFMKIYIS